MDATVQVAIVSACVSVVSASWMLYLTKKAERRDRLQQRKLEHYEQLMTAISDLASDGVDQNAANERFNRAVNTIVLVAPQAVVQALMEFHDEIRVSNPTRTQEGHDKTLKTLILVIRASLDLPFSDDPVTFRFHLIGRKPPGPIPRK